MYLDPAKMSPEFQQRIGRWLDANGCTHWIALEPVTIRGQIAEYTALIRKGDRSNRQVHGDELRPLGRKRLRLRIPLSAVA